MKYFFCVMFCLVTVSAMAQQKPSPYAGQETRDIKALSDEDIRAYQNGLGMALAKAGELNHYPGPLHVLELAGPLKLSDAQKRRTEEIRQVMLNETIPVGTRIIEKERELDQLFASGSIDNAKLDSTLADIGRLQGELRAAHLRAHLEQKKILTPEQVANYDELRGYTSAEAGIEHHMQH
ncbi:MAG TPA: Spy/CpxP family protein refolding chaperone [Candidatus Binatia bacterium]|jgi:Spy/CpxP family protein refolding chaperone